MAGQWSQEAGGSDEPRDEAAGGDFGNAGVGAASALETMKSQRERRYQRLHGGSAKRSGTDDDTGHER